MRCEWGEEEVPAGDEEKVLEIGSGDNSTTL